MNRSETQRQSRQMDEDRQELADLMRTSLKNEGVMQVRPDLSFSRFSNPTDLHHGFYEPCFCVIAQGAKTLTLGGETFRYDPAHYMVCTVGLPMTAQIVEASTKRPYLGLRLTLDPGVVASIIIESNLDPRGESNARAVDVSVLDSDLLDATLRLIRLIDKPDDYNALAPLVIREINYRLLTGAQGGRMRHLARFGGHANRMVRAVEMIRGSFDQPLSVADMAHNLGMSSSGFHAHFKAVTSMSPLQFQKQLRMQEARRLMLSEDFDAAEAGFKVGYEDASHFNRDYKRHFGAPPMRDIERMRQTADRP
ncbi:MAG: AraC family transcriptional regulator [Phycisphaerales bacterium]|nr:AraC family transcriptional regulator [Phycisphaerales bacterium]